MAASLAWPILAPFIEPDLSMTMATFNGARALSPGTSKPVNATRRYTSCFVWALSTP